MSKTATIQSTLYKSNPRGLRIHEKGIDILYFFEIPREIIKEIKNQPNINNSGVYFLLSENHEIIYIGQTDNIHQRITEHNQTKEFSKILAFVSKTNSFSRTDIDYLEWHYINEIKKAGIEISSKLSNKQKRDKKPNVSNHEEGKLKEIISSIDDLLFFIGIEINREVKTIKKENIFICNDSLAIYEEGKIIILKDSIIPSVADKIEKLNKDNKYYDEQFKIFTSIQLRLEELVKENKAVFLKEKNAFKLLVDVDFGSPTTAGNFAKGQYAASGWEEWKNESGETLNKVYRSK
ncbi:MAG: GIY-YIG nuclease family protein [Metamycoplasmataceae bacterium]